MAIRSSLAVEDCRHWHPARSGGSLESASSRACASHVLTRVERLTTSESPYQSSLPTHDERVLLEPAGTRACNARVVRWPAHVHCGCVVVSDRKRLERAENSENRERRRKKVYDFTVGEMSEWSMAHAGKKCVRHACHRPNEPILSSTPQNSKSRWLRAPDLNPQRLRRTDEVVVDFVQCDEARRNRTTPNHRSLSRGTTAPGQWRAVRHGIAGIDGNGGSLESATYRI